MEGSRHPFPPRQHHVVTDGLLRAWATQLLKDYQRINAFHLRGQLRVPMLDISPTLGPWGQWDANTRRLAIKLAHITDYSWPSVLETLKHEMAHQYVCEVMGLPDVEAHGEAWRRACALLGIAPAARSDGGVPISHAWAQPNAHGDPKLRKVRKLLALTENNSNPHEVQAALAQAQSYLLRYNLQTQRETSATKTGGDTASQAAMIGDPNDDPITVQWIGPALTRIEAHRYRIANILDSHFFVHCIWVPSYIAERDKTASHLEVCGHATHVMIAEYIHDALLRHLQWAWDTYRVEAGVKGIAARNTFWDGMLTGYASQLSKGEVQHKQQGLVWVGDKQVQALFKQRHPRTTTTSVTARRDTAIRRHGLAAGQQLRIARPVHGAKPTVRGFLT